MTGSIFLGANEYSVREGENAVQVAVRRTGDTSGAVTIEYSTNDDTAKAPGDYTTTSGFLTMAAGQSVATISIPIRDDNLAESTESFSVALISVNSGALLFPRTANVRILDDENVVNDPVSPPLTSEYQLSTTVVASGLAAPLGVEWIDGFGNQAIVVEKVGRLSLFDTATGTRLSTLLDISAKVNATGDRGLMDIALHPDLASNPYLYAFYTVDPPQSASATGLAARDGAGNRFAHVVRYELDLSGTRPVIVEGSETLLLGGGGRNLADISGGGALDFTETVHRDRPASDIDTATGQFKKDYIKVDSLSHAGGALAFGPDGMLYVATGDGTSFNYADPRTVSVQSPDSLAGKILRVDPITGNGLADNPFAGTDLTANAAKVWQTGLRNPYSMAFSEDGRLFISNTGWFRSEEIETGGKGANFGWPYFEGGDAGVLQRTPDYQNFPSAAAFYQAVANGSIVVTPAYRAFSHIATDPGYQFTAIVGASDIYDGNLYPTEFKGDYFFTDVPGKIYSVDVNDRSKLNYVGTAGTAPVSFSQGPDGALYFADLGTGEIKRLMITDPTPQVNRAPVVANALPFVKAEPGKALDFTVPAAAFFDADGDRLTLSVRLADGSPLPAWLKFDAATGKFTGTPPSAAKLAIAVTAADATGAVAADIFELQVAAINAAPVLAKPAPNATASEDVAFSFELPDAMFIDADAISLSARLANGAPLPTWLKFDAATGIFSGTPGNNDAGRLVVTVTATDTAGNTASDSFSLEITGQNDAPVSTGTVAAQQASTGQAFSLQLAANLFTDPDGDALTLSATRADGTALPAWLTFNAATRSFSGTPPAAETVAVKVTARDPSNAAASVEFNLTVTTPTTPNQAPRVANPIADRSTAEEANFSFVIPANAFSDPDGGALTYSARLSNGNPLPAWLNFDAATRTLSGRPDDPQVGTLQVEIVARDAGGLSVGDVFALTVTPVNDAPRLAAPVADQVARIGEAFSFTVPAATFVDVDNPQLTLGLTQASGSPLPAWLGFDARTGVLSGTPPQDAQDLTLKLTASDAGGLSASDEFILDVQAGGGVPPTETLFTDDSVVTQYLTGTTDRDVFVVNGRSSGYGWSKTQDGLGIVLWNATGHDLLYGFEAIRFSDVTIELNDKDSVTRDIKGVTQFLFGDSAADVFRIDGPRSAYNWGATEDGQGVVVWSADGHDLLYDFETLAFNDGTVDISQI